MLARKKLKDMLARFCDFTDVGFDCEDEIALSEILNKGSRVGFGAWPRLSNPTVQYLQLGYPTDSTKKQL